MASHIIVMNTKSKFYGHVYEVLKEWDNAVTVYSDEPNTLYQFSLDEVSYNVRRSSRRARSERRKARHGDFGFDVQDFDKNRQKLQDLLDRLRNI